MDDKRKLIDVVTNRLWRVSHKHAELENSPIRYDDKVTLSPREIHTIQAIGKKNNLNVKDLGLDFGISKSAASQMVSRLERKGYVVKNNPADNNKELCLSLTPCGWEAFSLHEGMHARHQEDLAIELQANFSEQELRRIEDFLRFVETTVDERLKEFVFKT